MGDDGLPQDRVVIFAEIRDLCFQLGREQFVAPSCNKNRGTIILDSRHNDER